MAVAAEPMAACFSRQADTLIGSYISFLGEQAVTAARVYWAEKKMKALVGEHAEAIAFGRLVEDEGLAGLHGRRAQIP